ncbi:MAG TPA: T9SS type A sorting domain-containing protein, partial [Bacteroidota bacterium]|nr:T9SS type A sorting domain-containing protein [Bacteroidota bacterium]
ARWVIPPTEGSAADFRDILTILHVQNIYTVRLQAGPGGFPFTLRWNNDNFPAGKFTLRDKATGGSQILVNMKTQDACTVATPTITQVEIVHDGPEFFPFSAGWNIVSLPLKPTLTKDKSLIFPSAVSKAFYFDNGYQFADSLDNGIAYWLKFSNAQNIGIDGDTVEADTIPLSAGWNMIGTITLPVPTAGIVQQPSNIVVSSYFGFPGSYIPTTTIEPARGYWVKAGAPGTLILSSGAAAAPKARTVPAEWEALSAMNGVTLTDRHGFRHTLRFGETYPDGVHPRSYELPPPPPAGIFDARFASDLAAELLEAGTVSSPILLRGARYPVTIELTPGGTGHPGTVDLVDVVTGATVATNVGPGSPFVLRDASVTSLIIRAGGVADVPAVFALHQNFPNPFNPATAITFDLASGATVSVRVYNILGQTVARLAENRNFDAGRHRLDFRADALGSGIYFCRMEAIGLDGAIRIFSVKMLLVK